MIHLDRGHPSAIAGHSKSNLILADPPHADQHSLLSWSPSTRTDTTFYHDSQEPFALTSDPAKHTIPSDPAPGQKQDQPAPATANHGPITPGDAEEPNLPEPSPSSPADPRSPVADTSSSLSPPPDAATPSAAAAAAAASDPGSNGDKPPGSGGEAAGEVEAPTEGDKGSSAEEVDKASRASTPLSELSSAPDDEEEYKTKEGGASVGGPSPSGHKETHEADGPNKSAPQGATSKGHASAASNAQSPREAPPEASSSHSNPAKFASDARGSSIIHSSSSSVSSPFSQPDIASLGSDVTLPNHVSAASAGAKLDPKVVTTLELNNQLLSVMTALLNRGYSSENPLVSQYGAHVQSNLAWLAAAADGKEKGRNNVPLPKMTPPPRIDFLSMDRIHQLYSEMSAAFAKEIARRAQAGAASHGMSLPGDLQNGLKRNRPDELFPDLANKRRDTGDSKLSTPIASTPQLSNAVTPHMNPGMGHNPANPLSAVPSLQGTPAPQLGSPAMPPPSAPTGMMGGANEAQLLAARERARQMQLQMQRQHMQQQQQQLAESNRQMSPPHAQQGGMGMSNMAGPSSMGGMQQQQQGNLAMLQQQSQGNPMLMRQYQILQTPNHPLMQYLTQQVQNFTNLPIPQQLQHIQNAQMILQQRQQRMAKESGGSMQNMNMMNPGMLANAGMSPGQISPTRSMQQASMPGSSSAGGNPYGNQGAGSGMGMHGAGLTPQQQAFLANMTPQQKQLYLMQQQQMRNGGMSNPGMMNPQMMAAAQERMQQQQQQRMAQAGMNANAGMQMPGAMDASGHIPALRSNPSMSGIARNTRTPSDSAPSPAAGMSQRISGHTPDDLQRAMMMQQAQQRGMAHQQMMQQQNAGGGMPQMNFQQNMQQQMSPMGQGQGSYGMSPPNSAGPGGGFGGGMQAGMGGTPQPGAGGQNQWQQNANGLGNGQFPFVAPSPGASQHHSDPSMTPRQMSATPAPGQTMAQNSPQSDQGGLTDFADIFNNWGQ